MAMNSKGQCPLTHWTHIENGHAVPRRFHKVIEHFGNSPGVELKSDRVPYAVVTHSGDGHRGQHELHFYYRGDTQEFTPNFRSNYRSQAYRRWYGFS